MDQERLGDEIRSVLSTIDRSQGTQHLGLNVDLLHSGRLSRLEAIVAADPDLSDFTGKMRAAGRMAQRLTAEGLALWLIKRAIATDVHTSLCDLDGYIGCDAFTYHLTVALAAIMVEGPVQLCGRVRLVPYSEQQFFEGFQRAEEPNVSRPNVSSRPTQSISSALQLTVNMPRLHYDSGNIPEVSATVTDAGFEQLEAARLCIGLVVPCVPFRVGDRATIDASVPISNGGMMSHGLSYPSADVVRLTPEQCADAADIHTRFSGLPPAVRDAMKVPIGRLESAIVSQRQTADSAIDLGIALEALFLSDDEVDELTYRLSIRGARFLREGLDDRRALRKTLSSLYRLRSKAVHRGVVNPAERFSGETASDLLSEGYRLVAAAIKAVIHQAQIPNWEDLVLR